MTEEQLKKLSEVLNDPKRTFTYRGTTIRRKDTSNFTFMVSQEFDGSVVVKLSDEISDILPYIANFHHTEDMILKEVDETLIYILNTYARYTTRTLNANAKSLRKWFINNFEELRCSTVQDLMDIKELVKQIDVVVSSYDDAISNAEDSIKSLKVNLRRTRKMLKQVTSLAKEYGFPDDIVL